MKENFAIMTDAGGDFTREIIAKYGIEETPMSTVVWPDPHYKNYIWLGASYLFYFYLLMGFTALFWPTRKMGRRVLVEGIYFTIKALLVFGIVALFIEFTPVHAWIAYVIALLVTFLLNFPLAYLWWKIKMNRK